MPAFDTAITEDDGVLAGPLRAPKQMLQVQAYDGHASIHDDATAQNLGFKGGTIEGPTHFSQFSPLGSKLWGDEWFRTGCLSAHYRNPVYEGEEVQAHLRQTGLDTAEIWMIRPSDGAEILRGSASVRGAGPTALDTRLTELKPLADPVILADVKVGMTTPRGPVRMDPDQHMGDLYPFSLNQKLAKITEPSPWYAGEGDTPFDRAVIPFEMLSVLMQYTAKSAGFPARGPAIGLFADQEIKLVDGPVFAGEAYEVAREVVALSGSKRTESVWVRTTLTQAGTERVVATMLLNGATLKDSYARYGEERAALYG